MLTHDSKSLVECFLLYIPLSHLYCLLQRCINISYPLCVLVSVNRSVEDAYGCQYEVIRHVVVILSWSRFRWVGSMSVFFLCCGLEHYKTHIVCIPFSLPSRQKGTSQMETGQERSSAPEHWIIPHLHFNKWKNDEPLSLASNNY